MHSSPSPQPDALEDPARPWQLIYVGVLTQVAVHPHADREVVVEVDAGWRRLTTVTGGPDVAVGHKVVVALPGARVLDPTSVVPRMRKLKKGRMRGILSEGMLCSAKELGFSDGDSAIYVLDPAAPVDVLLAAWLHGDVSEAARSGGDADAKGANSDGQVVLRGHQPPVLAGGFERPRSARARPASSFAPCPGTETPRDGDRRRAARAPRGAAGRDGGPWIIFR